MSIIFWTVRCRECTKDRFYKAKCPEIWGIWWGVII